MTEDYTFVDYEGEVTAGREEMKTGFQEYFDAYPRYKIHVSKVTKSGNDIAIVGTTTASHVPPELEATETVIWVAKIKGSLVAEWRIYTDLDLIKGD